MCYNIYIKKKEYFPKGNKKDMRKYFIICFALILFGFCLTACSCKNENTATPTVDSLVIEETASELTKDIVMPGEIIEDK